MDQTLAGNLDVAVEIIFSSENESSESESVESTSSLKRKRLAAGDKLLIIDRYHSSDMSLREFANSCDIDHSCLSRWITNKKQLDKIAKNTKTLKLLQGTENDSATTAVWFQAN